MRKLALFAATVAGAVGCAPIPQTPPRPGANTYSVGTSFDAGFAAAMMAEGVNSIRGSAFLRQQGGGVVTCAGSEVQLVPATVYAAKRFDALYLMTGASGINRGSRTYLFDPDPAEYYKYSRTTYCDAQGNFAFERIADGEFFVTTKVQWTVANRTQGGMVGQRVKVAGGDIKAIVISP